LRFKCALLTTVEFKEKHLRESDSDDENDHIVGGTAAAPGEFPFQVNARTLRLSRVQALLMYIIFYLKKNLLTGSLEPQWWFVRRNFDFRIHYFDSSALLERVFINFCMNY
jgi:hypothetical protein